MRVLLLATSTNLGGAEKQVLSLATALRRRGHEARIVSMIPPGPVAAEAAEQGIEVDSLGMRPGVPDPRAFFRLASIIRRWQPDVLHAHMLHANLLARLVRLVAPVPVVISTVHTADPGGRGRRLGYRYTDRMSTLTTVISHSAAAHYRAAGSLPRGARVIPNGVDTGRFVDDPAVRGGAREALAVNDSFVWLAIGRLEPPKDYPTLLDAFRIVATAEPGARLLIAGTGSLADATQRQSERLGLGEVVRFLGARNDVPGLMGAADAYVMSSAWEGLPLVLLEAAAARLPIVSTNVGGTSEVVADEQTGFLVPSRDPAALGAAMRRTMALYAGARHRMGEAGRALVETKFGLEQVVDVWEATYRELLTRSDDLAVAPVTASPVEGGQR